MKLRLRYYGDPVLRKKALPIAEITPEIAKLAHDMIDLVIEQNGIGLAATQVGELVRLFVIREEVMLPDGSYYLREPEIIINPVISAPSREAESMLEGCMSLPKLHIEVIRPKKIHIRYQNLKGEFIDEDIDTFRGRMMMHENDHLNGVLTIDRMDPKERKRIEPQLRAIKQKYSA